MNSQNPPRVFISHSSKDNQRFVVPFAARLRSSGVDAWLDKWEMNPGDSLIDRIFSEGIGMCSAMVVVLSHHSVSSGWVKEELDAGMVRKIEGLTKMIAIRLDACQVPDYLKHLIWIEINDCDAYDEPFKQIVNTIFGQYTKPPLGALPRHVLESTLQIGGLAAIDAKVLAAICQLTIEAGENLVNSGPLVNRLAQSGITEPEIIESQEVLENQGLIRLSHGIGPVCVCASFATMSGFERFAQAQIADYSDIVKSISLCVARGDASNNTEIAERLTLPIRVVDHVLYLLEARRLIRSVKSSGGGLHIDVMTVSPELRRKFME